MPAPTPVSHDLGIFSHARRWMRKAKAGVRCRIMRTGQGHLALFVTTPSGRVISRCLHEAEFADIRKGGTSLADAVVVLGHEELERLFAEEDA